MAIVSPETVKIKGFFDNIDWELLLKAVIHIASDVVGLALPHR